MDNNTSSIDHSKVETVAIKASGKSIIIDLPDDKVDAADLPPVTIVTVTRNRKLFFQLAIDNWKRIYYPHDKLTWLIIDDSDSLELGPAELLKPLKDKRILYYYLNPTDNTSHTIGHKRNLAMELSKTEYVAFMDDDDFLYDESILARVSALQYYNKGLVYSDNLGVYHTKHENSYILEGFADVPEGSIMLTKTFWNKSKFADSFNAEGKQLVVGRECDMLRIPFYFNLIVLNHGLNTTGSGRHIRLKQTRKIKDNNSTVAPLNFYKLFPQSFKESLGLVNSKLNAV